MSARVQVWVVDLARCHDPALLAWWPGLMSPAEQAQWQRFMFERDRHRYLVTRALVRVVLADWVGQSPEALVFEAGPHGRPSLAGEPGLSFNLSHTEGMVVLAISGDGTVGVDVEYLGRKAPLQVVPRYFSPQEAAALAACPEQAQVDRFWALWTLKESHIKATGLGLSMPLDEFSFDLDASPTAIGFEPSASSRAMADHWWFAQWPASPQHLASLCVASDQPVCPGVVLQACVPGQSAQSLVWNPKRASVRA